MTTLAGMAVEATDAAELNTLPNALEAISEWIDDYLQSHPTPSLYNPALPTEKFDRHWTQTQYDNFRKQFHRYTERNQGGNRLPGPGQKRKALAGNLRPKLSPQQPRRR